MLQLDALTVSLLISLVIPVVTGFVTKATLSSAWKGVITLVLNGLAAFITASILVDGSAQFTQQAISQWAIGMGVSVAMYTGVYKKAGITSSEFIPHVGDAPVEGKLGPAKGLGPSA